MRLHTHRGWGMLVGALMLAAKPAAADPVTIASSVSQIEVCYFNDSSNAAPMDPTCSSVPGTFLLTVNYDDGVTSAFEEVVPGVSNFQTRFIETLPELSLAGFPPVANPFGGPVITDGQITGQNLEDQTNHADAVFLSAASVASTVDQSSPPGFTERTWLQRFELHGAVTSPGPQDLIVNPVTTADIEARLRGALGPLTLEYTSVAYTQMCGSTSCSIFSIDYSPGSFTLRGVATPLGAVPEPASILLLGTGLAGLMYGRRRQTRQSMF